MEKVKFDSVFSTNQFKFLLKATNQSDFIPLKQVTHDFNIMNDIAQVQVQLDYENDSNDQLLEATFNFSISATACFHSFQAHLGDKIVQGQIKEKQQAENEYKEGLKSNKTMAISTIDPVLKDVIQVKLGNLEPKTPIKILLTYLQPLEKNNQYLQLRLPFVLSSRHNVNPFSTLQTYLQKNNYTPTPTYPWHIKGTITTINNTIQSLSFPSHPNPSQQTLEYLPNTKNLNNLNSKSFQFSLNLQKPDKDFILNFSLKSPISLALEPHPTHNTYTALLTLNPNPNPQNPNPNPQNPNPNPQNPNPNPQNPNPNPNFQKSQPQEFIFILDRSGSMWGDRIKMAREALINILEYLPPGSYFNIVSFGTQFQPLYVTPKKLSNKTLKNTIQSIKNMDSDFGGTDILQVLKYIYENLKMIEGYARNLFLLTDGGVEDSQSVLNLAEKYSKSASIFTLGIGNGVSQHLLTKLAEIGEGKAAYITNNKMLQTIQSLVDCSFDKKFIDFKLNFDQNKVKFMVPDLNSMNFIRENQSIQTFIVLEKGFQETEISLSINGKNLQKPIKIKENNPNFENQDQILHKLAHFNLIRKHLQNTLSETDPYDDIYVQKKQDQEKLKQESLQICLKYQILSELTAFICQIKNLKDEIIPQNLPLNKIQVPNTLSHDYSQPSNPNPNPNPRVYQAPRRYIATSAARMSAPCTGGVKKPHRFRPGTVSLREIRKLQKSTDCIIPKSIFKRIVKFILQKLQKHDTKVSKEAYLALQEAVEYHLVELFQRANKVAIHSKRVTLMKSDLDLILQLF